jgi:hypothetical protein
VNRSSWHDLSFETKSAFVMLAAVLLGVAGFLAAAGLAGLVDPASEASDGSKVVVETLTVKRTVVKQVQVVRRVTERSGVLGKQVELVTVTTPGRTVRTIGGTTRTSVVTSEHVVTREHVVTNQRVKTVERTVERPVTTTRVVTEKLLLPETILSTDTVRVTQTSAPVVVTVERPVTVTVTVTVKRP